MSLPLGFFRLLLALSLSFFLTTAWAQTSGTMVVVVTVAASSDGKNQPTATDVVIATNSKDGQVVGQSDPAQQSVAGTYQIVVSNAGIPVGTSLTLSVRQNSTVLPLLDANGKTAAVVFNASGIFFTQVQISTHLPDVSSTGTGGTGGTGTTTGGSTGSGTSTGSTTTLVGDINGDGKVDQKDVDLLKQALSGQIAVNTSRMDVNIDKVVNTRDLIDLLRALRTAATPKPQSVVDAVRRK